MPVLLLILAAVFGASAAAFLPRIVHRLAVAFGDEPRHSCAVCSRPFGPGFPGWVRAGSACPCAGGALRTVIAGAMVCALLAAALGPVPVLPVYLLATIPGLLLALIDLRCLRLPDPIVAALAITAGVPLAILHPGRVVPGLMTAVAVLTAYGILALLPRGGLGLGDVKLSAVLALILSLAGGPAVIVGLVVPHLISGPIVLVLLLTRRATRRQAVPFGPALLVGALLGITAT